MKTEALDEYWDAIARLPEVHEGALRKAVAAERADRDLALARLAALDDAWVDLAQRTDALAAERAELTAEKRATEARAIRWASEMTAFGSEGLRSLADKIESGEATVT